MECDVAVLGGGPAGYTAAIRAAQLGGKVVCIEQEPALGGTCLRVGCIPTKAWVQTAHALHDARETFAKLGVGVSEPQLDFTQAAAWKDGVVTQMTGGVAAPLQGERRRVGAGQGPVHERRPRSRSRAGRTSPSRARSSRPAPIRCGRRFRASTRRAASTRPASSPRRRCRAGSSCSAAASSAASSHRSSRTSAAR